MKTAGILFLSFAFASGVFAQGLVDFLNTPATLTSATINGVQSAATGPAGSWYYGLLVGSISNPAAFTFTGLYATNLAVPGRFFGAIAVPVPGWAAGVTTNYAVAMWSASLGHDFNPAWLSGHFDPGLSGNFGVSSIATGTAGGFGSPATPAYGLFGGATGIQAGFNALPINTIPEPSSIALTVLGLAVMLFRRPETACQAVPAGR